MLFVNKTEIERVIAMSFPSSGIDGFYRNRIEV
jgi:hypothetical protein